MNNLFVTFKKSILQISSTYHWNQIRLSENKVVQKSNSWKNANIKNQTNHPKFIFEKCCHGKILFWKSTSTSHFYFFKDLTHYFNFKRFQKTMSMLIFSLDQPLTINQRLNFIIFCHYSKKMARPLLFWNCKTNKTVETEIYWLFVIWFLVTGCFNERNEYKIIKQMFSKLNFHNLASNFECLFWLSSSICH